MSAAGPVPTGGCRRKRFVTGATLKERHQGIVVSATQWPPESDVAVVDAGGEGASAERPDARRVVAHRVGQGEGGTLLILGLQHEPSSFHPRPGKA